MLLPQDPGSGRTPRTSTETIGLLPSPAVGAELDIQADPQPYSPPLSPCSHLSASSSLLLSLCLPACTGTVYRTGPQWPWVINGHYDANVFLPSTFVCGFYPLSFARLPKRCTHYYMQLKTAPLQWREPTLLLGNIN